MSTPLTSIVWRYFAIPSSEDLSDAILLMSLDRKDWFWASPVPEDIVPADEIAQAPTVNSGEKLYWWRVLTGPGTSLVPSLGNNIFYGQLQKPPEVIVVQWRRTIRYAERKF